MPVSRAGARAAALLFVPAALALALRGTHPVVGPVVALSAWTLALAVAAFGIGAVVERTFAPPAGGLGLRLGYGFATMVWAVGCLAAMRIGTQRALAVVAGVGTVAALVEVLRAPPELGRAWTNVRRTARAHPFATALSGLALAWLGVRFVLALRMRSTGFLYDDGEAYLVFVRQLLETGSFDQPLSVRRLQSFGGMTALLGLLFADGGSELVHAYVLDWGLGPLLCASAILGVPRADARARAAALVLLALSQQPRTNASPQYVAVFFGLSLVRALQAGEGARGLSARIPIGLVAAALASLRQSLLPWAALLIVAHHAVHLFARRPARTTGPLERVGWGVVDGALTAAFLVPWMVQAQRLFGTPLYPLLRGNVSDEGAAFMVARVSLAEHVANFHTVLVDSMPFTLAATLLLVASALLRGRGSTLAVVVAWAVTLAVQVHALPLTDGASHARYAFAAALASALAIVVGAAPAPRESLGRAVALAAVVVALVVGRAQLAEAERTVLVAPSDSAADDHTASYDAAQATIPPGDRVLVMAEESYRLHYARNSLVILDFPGALGGLPAKAGAHAILAHLRGAGFRWLFFERPSVARGMYSRVDWLSHQRFDADHAAHAVADSWLGTFDAFEVLSLACERAFDDGRLVVVDLDACAPLVQLRPRT